MLGSKDCLLACATQPVSYLLNHFRQVLVPSNPHHLDLQKSYLRKFMLLLFVKTHHMQDQMEPQ